MYVERHSEETVRKLRAMFGAVLITGPRQVGKTTMATITKAFLNCHSIFTAIKT